MNQKLKIIFFGTPDFAVASLSNLIQNDFDVVAVVTAPDRKSGRGMKLHPSAVKSFAVEHNIPVLQPTNLKSSEFQAELNSYNANIQVVIAFRMLPEAVWNIPALGTVNLHASLLPQYRGAAPINWAIINGEKESGVTTFRLKHEIDTGNILLYKKVEINAEDNAGSLHDKLMHTGAELMIDTLTAIESGKDEEKEQLSVSELKHAPKIYKEDCLIDWNKSANEIHNLVRGLSPYPVSRTIVNGDKTLKVFITELVDEESESNSGTIISDSKNKLIVQCGKGTLEITEVQLEGKKRMSTEDFLKGFEVTSIG